MLINKLSIKKFRSIKDGTFRLSTSTALVGENNSGKSSILKALNAFFNINEEERDFIEGKHDYANTSIPSIEVTFKDVPNKPFYVSKLYNNEFTIRLIYHKRNKKFKYQYLSVNKKYIDISPEDLFKELNNDIQFYFIPATRDYQQMILSKQNLLWKIINLYLQKATSKRDSISPKVTAATNFLKDNYFTKIGKSIKNVYSHNHSFNFILDYEKNINYELLLQDLTIYITEYDKTFPLNDCGTGIQSLINIALYRYLAQIQNANIILGIDEPETHLHPQSQIELIKSIQKSTPSNEIQIIFTTHSSVIVNQIEHQDIVLCRKKKNNIRGFETSLCQVPVDFFLLHKLTDIKYYQFYKCINSDFFYAKFAIIVESNIDSAIIRQLLLKAGFDIDLLGISIIELGGVKNLGYPLYLLKDLKIPYIIILDKDFFLPYLNDEKKESRNTSGYFKYKKNYRAEPLINILIPNTTIREKLLKLFHTNYSKSLDILADYNIICFNYNLEMDLTCSFAAKEKFFEILNIPLLKRTTNNLLTNYSNAIKKPDVLLKVVNTITHQNLPHSYKRIKKLIPKKYKEAIL